MPIYLLIAPVDAAGDVDNDKALKGDVTTGAHVHWIEVTSFRFKNQGRPGTPTAIMSNGPSDVTFSRDRIDGISPILMRWSGTGAAPFKGTVKVMAIMHVVNGDQFYEIRLSDIILSAYQAGKSGPNERKDNGRTNISESFTLSYSEIVSNHPPGRTDQNTDDRESRSAVVRGSIM